MNGKKEAIGSSPGRKDKEIKIKPVECPDCKSRNIFTCEKYDEVLCGKCGLVIEDNLYNFGVDYISYTTEEKIKKERTGSPLKFSKQLKGLTTEIDRYNRDINGRPIPAERIIQMYRLRKLHKRTRISESGERNLSIALNELNRMCSCLNIPNNIKEECAKLYRKALNMGLIKGRSIEASISAIIYFVLRKNHTPKTLRELANISGLEKRDIGRAYTFFCKKMKFKLPVSGSSDYIHYFACNLNLSGELEAKANELFEMTKKQGINSGRSPVSIAAAVIYFASGIPLKEFSGKIPEVGKTTLINRCKEMAEELKLNLNEKL